MIEEVVVLNNGQEAPWDRTRKLAAFPITVNAVIEGCYVRKADGSLGRFKPFAKPVNVVTGDRLYVNLDFFE